MRIGNSAGRLSILAGGRGRSLSQEGISLYLYMHRWLKRPRTQRLTSKNFQKLSLLSLSLWRHPAIPNKRRPNLVAARRWTGTLQLVRTSGIPASVALHATVIIHRIVYATRISLGCQGIAGNVLFACSISRGRGTQRSIDQPDRCRRR